MADSIKSTGNLASIVSGVHLVWRFFANRGLYVNLVQEFQHCVSIYIFIVCLLSTHWPRSEYLQGTVRSLPI